MNIKWCFWWEAHSIRLTADLETLHFDKLLPIIPSIDLFGCRLLPKRRRPDANDGEKFERLVFGMKYACIWHTRNEAKNNENMIGRSINSWSGDSIVLGRISDAPNIDWRSTGPPRRSISVCLSDRRKRRSGHYCRKESERRICPRRWELIFIGAYGTRN